MAHFPTVNIYGVGPNAPVSEGMRRTGIGKGRGVRSEGEEECHDECGLFSVNWLRVIFDE